MTSEVLRKLEAKGLIMRAVDAVDTRARRLRVTERGGELAVRAVAAVEGRTPRSSRPRLIPPPC
jgi:DNA-binding MarR family transcriptional regulator